MSSDVIDKAREEFFSEAQEIIEGFSRDLLALDDGERRGRHDPELVNDIFRAVHTLKGLAGLFGASRMSGLSHDLEEILDDLRLGRRELTREVLDVLFRAVDVFGQILLSEREQGKSCPPEIDVFLGDLSRMVHQQQAAPASSAGKLEYDLDAGLLAVLTEYEEHRLRTCIQSGMALFRVRVNFRLVTIDEELEHLKEVAKPLGEIITYLPTGEGSDIEMIELEVVLAAKATLETVVGALGGPSVRVEELARRRVASQEPVPSLAPSSDRVPELSHEVGSGSRGRSDAGDLTPGPAGAQALSLRSVSQTVRVDIRKLDHLMNIVGELAIVRSSLSKLMDRVRSQGAMRELGVELHRLQRTFDRHLGQMQDGILEVRMVPIGQIFEKLGRVTRQASREAGKQVNLVITGAETEVDKLIVEELSDPLMHMVRNAVEHGIEPASERVQVGKPEVGTIAINAFQKGSHVLIELEDDGRGIVRERLLEAAVRRGFLSEAEGREMAPRDVFALIFLPGFTTKETPNILAGRGVGMDIVKTNIARLGGIIDVYSEAGIGTKMTITLPITLAILSALIVQVGEHAFAVPMSSVQEALVHDPNATRLVDGREMMTLRGTSLPLARLTRLFGVEGRAGRFIVVVAAGARRLGVVVDHLEGQQDIVIKPLGRSLRAVRGFAGAAQLGDQRVGLVIDAPALVEEVLAGEAGKTSLGVRRDVA
jgi:two-component system chemotaxis sensor kinase CheA